VQRLGAIPAWLYQRYRVFFDRLVPAFVMALLFVLTDQTTGTFSREWHWSIAGGILGAGLAAPVVGYIAFILALAYPLYSISIYIAALALSILTLMAFLAPRHLTPLMFALMVPLLASWRIAVMVPLLAGLWWAEWGGVLIGTGSALWLKVFAGMCGITPDLTQLGGQTLTTHHLIERFHAANSLQTLLWLAEPLAPDSETLLLNLLEVIGWGLAGYGVALVGRRLNGMSRPRLGFLAGVSAGLLGIGLGSLVLPVILDLRARSALSIFHLSGFLLECATGSIIAAALWAVSRHLTRPAVVHTRSQTEPYRPKRAPAPSPQPLVRPQAREDEPTDIIMIDLD
jgi:hypothetical protein